MPFPLQRFLRFDLTGHDYSLHDVHPDGSYMYADEADELLDALRVARDALDVALSYSPPCSGLVREARERARLVIAEAEAGRAVVARPPV